jgi:hypothetical protein
MDGRSLSVIAEVRVQRSPALAKVFNIAQPRLIRPVTIARLKWR